MLSDRDVVERQTEVVSGEISPLSEVEGWGADPRNLMQRESHRRGIFWGVVPGWGGGLLLVRHNNHPDLTIYRASELYLAGHQ